MVYQKKVFSEVATTQIGMGIGDVLRNVGNQADAIASQNMKQADTIYKNEFNNLMLNDISGAYSRNKDNPSGLQKELSEMKKGFLKNVYSDNARQELDYMFDIKSSAYVEKSQDIFNKQQKEQLELSNYKSVESLKLSMQDIGSGIFSDNPKTQVNSSLTFASSLNELDTLLSAKDSDGRFIYTPEQQQNKRKEFMYSVSSASVRNAFDVSGDEKKFDMLNKFKSKNLNLNIPDGKGGVIGINIDSFYDRTQYEQDRNYMERWEKEYNAGIKNGKLKEVADNEAINKVKAYMGIDTQIKSLNIKKDVIENKELRDVSNVNNIMNSVYSNLKDGLISESEAQGFLKTLNPAYVNSIEKEYILPRDSFWNRNFKFSDNPVDIGVKEVGKFIDKFSDKFIGAEKTNFKASMYNSYFNTLEKEGFNRENLGKAPREIIDKTILKIQNDFTNGVYGADILMKPVGKVVGSQGGFNVNNPNAELQGSNVSMGNTKLIKRPDGSNVRLTIGKDKTIIQAQDQNGKIYKEYIGKKI